MLKLLLIYLITFSTPVSGEVPVTIPFFSIERYLILKGYYNPGRNFIAGVDPNVWEFEYENMDSLLNYIGIGQDKKIYLLFPWIQLDAGGSEYISPVFSPDRAVVSAGENSAFLSFRCNSVKNKGAEILLKSSPAGNGGFFSFRSGLNNYFLWGFDSGDLLWQNFSFKRTIISSSEKELLAVFWHEELDSPDIKKIRKNGGKIDLKLNCCLKNSLHFFTWSNSYSGAFTSGSKKSFGVGVENILSGGNGFLRAFAFYRRYYYDGSFSWNFNSGLRLTSKVIKRILNLDLSIFHYSRSNIFSIMQTERIVIGRGMLKGEKYGFYIKDLFSFSYVYSPERLNRFYDYVSIGYESSSVGISLFWNSLKEGFDGLKIIEGKHLFSQDGLLLSFSSRTFSVETYLFLESGFHMRYFAFVLGKNFGENSVEFLFKKQSENKYPFIEITFSGKF